MKEKNLKWLGFIIGVVITVFLIYSITTTSVSRQYFLQMAVMIAPAILASVVSLYEKYDWLYLFGGWYLAVGIYILTFPNIGTKESQTMLFFLILPSLILFFIPVIDKAVYKKEDK